MDEGRALAEGFYWYAEKLMWGYANVNKDPKEALRLYRQAANLGCSDANIRIGQIYEYGKGAPQSATEALRSYREAAEAGNFLALAFMAKLISRTQHAPKAEPFWRKFFRALEADPEPTFLAASPGG